MSTMHDDELPVVAEDSEPVWFRYAINTQAEHDKFYELSIDLDDQGRFVVTRRWGRRPDYLCNGQSKTERPFRTLHGAITFCENLYQTKLSKGYREHPRGW